MKQEKPLLETFKEVFDGLEKNGLVTREELEKGFDIPISWLASTGIQRDVIIGAIRNLYEREHPNNGYILNRFKRNVSINYIERNGKPSLEIFAGKRGIFITDEKEESEVYKRNVISKDFVTEIPKYKRKFLILQDMYQNEKTKEQATKSVETFYNSYQQQSDLYATPYFLNEMAINFGEYYKWLQEEKKEIENENKEVEGPIETMGGLVELRPDEVGPRAAKGDSESRERKSDIYTFEQRDTLFRELKPIRIISFDTRDEEGRLIRGAYTCYVYKHNEEDKNKGYFMISEPESGDKETRTVYVTEQEIKEMKEGKENNEFWNSLAREYIEMTRKEFSQKDGTYTFRHCVDLESYKLKMEALIKGPSKQNPQTPNGRRARFVLFRRENIKNDIVAGVTESGINQARAAVPALRMAQAEQTKEGDVRNEQ